MASGKAIIVGVLGIGAIALIAKKASSATSTTAATTPTTKVDQALAKAQSKVVTPTKDKIDKAKGYAAKGTAEAQAAIDAVNKLLK